MLIRLLTFCWLILAGVVQAAEPLDPEQAYKFSARALDEKTIEARWDIQPDYYLYRHKIAFHADGAKLGEPALPKGKEKDDEFFGKIEAYRGQLVIRIPVIGG
jgi:thiol:disulfide interchange protein DsbD